MIRTLLLVVLVALGAAAWWKPDEAAQIARRVPVLGPTIAGYLTPGAAPAAAPTRTPPAVPVVVARVEAKSIPITVEAVGTVQAVASIQIKPRVDSQIASIAVEEGALVKAGDLLVTLDDRVLKAQLAQAEATILKTRAQIQQLRRDLGRFEELFEKRIGTEVQRDTAATSVKVQEAQLAADQAQRDSIATSLTYTQIRSPISGRIGSISLKIGTTVRSADAQAIMTVNQVDPIYVSFSVPQSLFGDLRQALNAGPVAIEALVGGGSVPGRVAFVENSVDLATGTVAAKALMQNRDERLWPGACVAVRATLSVQADAIAVPSAAVQLGQRGPYVFVIGEGRKATLVPVTVDRTTGGESVIAKGLTVGQQVVTDGQLRLVDGATVQIQPGRPGDGRPGESRPLEGRASEGVARREGAPGQAPQPAERRG